MVGAVRVEDGLHLAHQGSRRRIRKAEAVEDALRPGGWSRAARSRVEGVHRLPSAEIRLVVGAERRSQIDSEVVIADRHAFDLVCGRDREVMSPLEWSKNTDKVCCQDVDGLSKFGLS